MCVNFIPFLIAASTGELNESVRNKIEKIKKKIYFINRTITEDKKMYLLKNSKFMVFPSIYTSEAFGTVQLEAMIYSKPVININLQTEVSWVSLNDVSGLTVESSDSKQLAEAIEKTLF